MNVWSCPKDLLFPFSPYHGDLPPTISTLIVPKHRASLVIYAVDLTAHVSRAKREILAPNKNPKEFECGTRFRLPAKTVTGSPAKPREEKKEESKWGQARERKSMIDSIQDKFFLMVLFVSLSTSRSSNKTKTPNQIIILQFLESSFFTLDSLESPCVRVHHRLLSLIGFPSFSLALSPLIAKSPDYIPCHGTNYLCLVH